MYRAYELKFGETVFKPDYYARLKAQARNLFSAYKRQVEENLARYRIDTTSIVDGDAVESKWFPKKKFDVFISHSHRDLEFVGCLALCLRQKCGLEVFVDSLVWGYKDDLVNRLYQPEQLIIRNESEKQALLLGVAAHVDGMLQKSLMEIMDECETLFFLNTPNSVSAKGVVHKTYSPWLYAELEASKRLRIRIPVRRKQFSTTLFESGIEDKKAEFKIEHNADTGHLSKMDGSIFAKWVNSCTEPRRDQSLDKLYNMFD